MPPIEKEFKRHIDSLSHIFDFIDRLIDEEKIDDDTRHAVFLAVDELFTNMVKYHPQSLGDILVGLNVVDQALVVRLVDQDVESFDMTRRPDPDLSGTLEQRKPGGLGIFLTKKFMDDVQYEHRDRTSTIILKKKFRRKNV